VPPPQTGPASRLTAPADEAVTALVRALDRGEIVPWYQPLVELTTGRMVGLEALARWEHPPGTVEEPATFVPLAERSRLVVDLDRAVMRRAFADLAGWRQRHPSLRLSVNLSGRHLDRDDWVAQAQQAVEHAGLTPDAITLELTETVRPAGPALGVACVTQARDAGFQVWFDDFGSGWAGLPELATFPLDGIKIQRSSGAAAGEQGDHAVMGAVTAAAARLGLPVTVEGIETPLQAATARDLGCRYGQGYLYGRPVPAAALGALLDAAEPGTGLPLLG
jgi:EAL domain-containing protein (putative c-di-GMP-specific phosphodiesterase class I)